MWNLKYDMNELTYKTERDSQTERRLVAAVREEERGGWLGLADVKSFSRVRLFVTPWTVVYQAPPSTRYSRQEYWSGLPLPSPGDLPNPGIEPGVSCIAGRFFTV